MRAQLTISVNAGKWLIAKAICNFPEVKHALKKGRVLLKGGTTVSCIAEELAGIKLEICGRITKRGTVAGKSKNCGAPHSILITDRGWENVDDRLLEVAHDLGPEDVVILGANAVDSEGNAAMMAGSPGGGPPGKVMTVLMTEGANIIVAAGLEKLIPGRVYDAVSAAGRKNCDFSMGMAVGLMPIKGKVITELEAIKAIADVKVTVIGKGGIEGGEGSTTVVVEGNESQIKTVIQELLEASKKHISGNPESLIECRPGCSGCKDDLACYYSSKNRFKPL